MLANSNFLVAIYISRNFNLTLNIFGKTIIPSIREKTVEIKKN